MLGVVMWRLYLIFFLIFGSVFLFMSGWYKDIAMAIRDMF